MEGSTDRAFHWVTLALAAGLAAGTAAAVTSAAFPYAFGAAFTVLRSKRKKEQREHRHRSKAEKVKRTTSKPKEGQAYRAAIRSGLLNWKDIDVTFEKFPYFVNDNTKSALLDSMYVYLKRPEFTKYTADLTSVSPRILLTGPTGSEIYQEHLVKGLAHQLQVNLLIFDSTRVSLEASESVPGSLERIAEGSSAANQLSTDASVELPVDASPNDMKDLGSSDCLSSSSDGKPETLKALRSTSMLAHSKDVDTDAAQVAPLPQLRSKSKGEAHLDANSLVTVVAAAATAASTSTTVDSRRLLKKGDRVKYVGTSIGGASGGVVVLNHGGPTGGPAIGARGRVLVMLEENPNKAGVRFDKPVYGGNNLVDLCEDGHGFFCNVTELRLENSPGEDADKLVLDSLLEVLLVEASKEPLILFMKNVEKSIIGNFERYMKLERLEKTDARLVVIGSHTSDLQKEKGSSGSSASQKLGNNFTALLDISFLDHLASRMEDYKGDGPKASKMLLKLFPTKIHVQQPQEESQLLEWNQQLEQDTEKLKAETNRQQLRMVMGASSVECHDLSNIEVRTHVLTHDMAEKVVGWGISHHLQTNHDTVFNNGKLVIGAESLQHSLQELQSLQRGSSPRKKNLKDVICDNEFEKMLLPEVIPPDELGVTFDHIGALDNVKETLRELVMLPLQRPELFVKGQLTKACYLGSTYLKANRRDVKKSVFSDKWVRDISQNLWYGNNEAAWYVVIQLLAWPAPCRGLLLFGPPGTGKTMLAKAVATEAGANFINISMSTIASKWFGEAEKYVKAVFTLASKISPSVIFIDEVDSMLGRRGKDTEHSAMRKLKNEFMGSWDGLRTREKERVLVLAATNRPFDLDEAVIRRFPRRLMIDLPDAENRAKILRVILAEEDVSSDFNVDELAAATDGYSGSDLKSLCTTAAYRRIRELLDQEKKDTAKAKEEGLELPLSKAGVVPYIRPLNMADMRQAIEKVRSSVSTDAGSMVELQQWNEQYGEGGTRKKTTLSYFM